MRWVMLLYWQLQGPQKRLLSLCLITTLQMYGCERPRQEARAESAGRESQPQGFGTLDKKEPGACMLVK